MSLNVAYPLRRERNVILGLLLLLSSAAWALLVWESRRMGSNMDMGLTMGAGAMLFLALWVVMMVAMMFPTAAPMILTFARVSQGRRAQGQSFVPTWFFVTSYLVVWAAFGVLAYLGADLANFAGARAPFLHENSARFGGGILLVAGLYQLSPFKLACLSKCRTPVGFVLSSWKDGYGGAFEMGLRHGAYCLGCCWLLFVVLFPLGIMNVAAMGVVTLVIFAEKSLTYGVWVGRVAGVALLVWGLAVLLMPSLLPGSM